MASNDQLRRQVESLRQRNTSLQQEILDNHAHLSRLHENSTHLARLTSSNSAPSSISGQSASSSRSEPTSWQSANSVAVETRQNLGQASPQVNRSSQGLMLPSASQNSGAILITQAQTQRINQGAIGTSAQQINFNPGVIPTSTSQANRNQAAVSNSMQPITRNQVVVSNSMPQTTLNNKGIVWGSSPQVNRNQGMILTSAPQVNSNNHGTFSTSTPQTNHNQGGVSTSTPQINRNQTSLSISVPQTVTPSESRSLKNSVPNVTVQSQSSTFGSNMQDAALFHLSRLQDSPSSRSQTVVEQRKQVHSDTFVGQSQVNRLQGQNERSRNQSQNERQSQGGYSEKLQNAERSHGQAERSMGQAHGERSQGQYSERSQGLDISQIGDTSQCFDFNNFTDAMEGEHMAVLEDGSDLTDNTQIDLVTPGNHRGQGSCNSLGSDAEGSQGSCTSQGSGIALGNDQEILERIQQLENEKSNLVQQIEAEERNRKWYYDQIEVIMRKIRSLPVGERTPSKQPGLTRKHLEFEIQRLQDTMTESFGSNEQIAARHEGRVQIIRRLQNEMMSLQKKRQEILQEKDQDDDDVDNEVKGQQTSDSVDLNDSSNLDLVTMATQTENEQQDEVMTFTQHNIPGAIYHGAWQLDESISRSSNSGHRGDLASVMSFTSTNTASSRGSVAKGQVQGQQMGPVPLQIAPQQLGTKVEMVYGLLSMLGTHDKDDMAKTLLAMSSSPDSCIVMRQSGCLPLLIQLLHGSDQDSALLGNTRGSKPARARASAALHNIVHSHPDDKRGRREARVLRLLEQIRGHCDQLRESSSDEEEDEAPRPPDPMDHHPGPAIATLMKLSFDEEHRHAICTLGGLHAIAELLQVDTELNQDTTEQYNITMRRYACMALTNLTFGDGTNKALLCSMKPSMDSLVAQLFSSNEELCQVAASVLRNLSWKADLASKKTLREVGAVTSLMKAAMRVQKETTLKSILSALWNLSAHCSENKADICAVKGALEFLIGTLTFKSPSKTSAIIENGGGILRNVSSHIAVREDYRQILREHGCMQILLKHLRATSLTIVSNACGTLWNLSARCAEDQQALWEMGAVGMLRNLVHSKHKMISMGSSAALKNLLAARPAMKNIELNKHSSQNRPSLHVRKQRALESELDQNLSETCENVESPRDSPVEGKKQDSSHFVYPVFQDGDPRRPLVRAPVMPRSQSGDNALYANTRTGQGVARSGSQDSVGSTHSDISHDRARHVSGGNQAPRSMMGGSLDRHRDESLGNQRGQTERNPLGSPNSRILKVMQEVAMHAGIDSKSHGNDSTVFKVPFPVQNIKPKPQQQPSSSSNTAISSQNHINSSLASSSSIPSSSHHPYQGLINHMQNQSASYQRYHLTTAPAHGNQNNFASLATGQRYHCDDDSDEQPLDYSMKYKEGGSLVSQHPQGPRLPHPQPVPRPGAQFIGNHGNAGFRGRFPGNMAMNMARPPFMYQQDPNMAINPRMPRPGNKRFQFNNAYAETDLDEMSEQPTDYSARYGVEYNHSERGNFRSQYDETDPDCADCKYEEARRFNDHLDQANEDDQIRTFCTEDTPHLSTATSLTDLSTAMKILEEAEENCPEDDRDLEGDETQNYGSKYGETDSKGQGHQRLPESGQGQRSDDEMKGQRFDGEKSSWSGSNVTDMRTATTVISNYHLKADRRSQESVGNHCEEPPERSFHANRSEDAPLDQTKTYCEEGTPVCFSRVSSLSSLHSSEANDRAERVPNGPLTRIDESDDVGKLPSQSMSMHTYRQTKDGHHMGDTSSEKEHKTVTFDDKEQVQETPMMFSRCTSLGSLSSFDTQSVHSSVFSEYSRRASEVVSPSELPDSPSETMPPSPKRTKSPERNARSRVQQELFPPVSLSNEQFRAIGNSNALRNFFSAAVMGGQIKPIDYETGSCKSEAPVVYADEGTPPIFNDNLSELSCITSDAYNINDKTLVGSQGGNMTPGAKSHSSGGTAGSQGRSVGSAILMKENTNTRGREDSKLAAKNENDHQKSESETKHALGTVSQQSEHKQTACESNEAAERWETSDKGSSECKDMVSVSETSVAASRVEEKAESSNSEVSEGEDDILANFISSAMPTSTKKSSRSSESASRRRSSSSKPDSGSSSRLKTPNSSQPQSGSSSKSASVNSSAKKSKPSNNNTSTSSKENSPENKSSSKENMASQEPRSSPGKSKSQIPRPLQHRQLQQLTAEAHVSHLDTSLDSNLEDESPFNVSNTQSVMARSAQKTRPLDSNMTQKQQHQPNRPTAQPSPLILQKARHLSNMDYGDDDDTGGCKTYATEDTPFSRSIQASPKAGRKLNAAIMYPDVGADTVRSFATEDTPFSGSMSGSPPPEGQQGSYGNDVDIEPDTIKCYNTEDTPFSGSALGSPKLERKIQALPNNKPAVSQPQPQIDTKNVPSTSAQSQHRFHFGPPLSSTSQEQNKVPARNDIYDNRMVNNFGYQFDDVDDVKTFAVEGTPLDYSRTGSCSDLSCLNSNFDDKLYLNPAVSTSNGAVTGNGNAPFTNVKTSNSNQNSATPASNLSSGKFQQGANQSESSSNKATVANNQSVFHSNAVVDDQSDSSSLDENDDLLSEVIMSAMPAPKAVGKSRRSIDRKPEGAETSEMDKFRVSNISNPSLMSRKPNISSYPANFQPQRTSSLAQDGVSNCISVKNGIGVRNGNSNFQHVVSDPAEYLDQVKTYAVEDTPSVSNNTSLSNLTNHSGMNKSAKKFSPRSQPSASAQSLSNNSVLGSSYSQPVSYGMGNDLVFFQNEGVGDSMRVWKTEDTPKSFSCNDSLSSLGIVDDDSNNIVAQQMKALVDKMTFNTGNQSANNQSIGGKGALRFIEQGLESGVLKRSEFIESDLDKQRSASRTSVFSNISQNSGNELVRHVIGQSSEEQSIHEEDHKSSANSKEPVEEVKSYTVEDTPICFSRSSSLSSINDKDGDKQPAKIPEPDKRTTVSNKQASKDEKAGYQVEHTPICFSRNSSLSSLSVHSDDDDDDDPDDLALLEDCISSAMPQKTRQSRDRRPDSRGSNASNSSASVAKPQRHTEPRYEQSIAHGGHDSRLSSWQAQPLKPSDEMFRKPTMDAKGRPCRRSRSQDNEKYLKDLSNQQLVQQYGRNSIHRSSIDSIPVNQLPINQNAPAIVSKQIISETKNFTHQMMQMTRSADKGDNRDSDAVSSPASDYNFFMTCSGNTEISVEGISKESFPSNMAPDTDDDFLDGSLISSYKQDGHHSGPGSSHESTLIERNGSLSLNSTLTDGHHNNRRSAGNKNNHRHGMEVSLTSEDERALAENAKIVVSAMKIQQQMIVSGASTVDDDRFVENETLSLVSNDYASDTASEASDLPSENSSGRGDGRSQSGGRPRIVKPGDIGSQITPKQMEDEVKGVRGKRKPLYHNKAANSPMGDQIRSPGVGKMSPRSVPGSAATNNHNLSNQHQSSNTSRSFNTSGAPVNTSGRSANNSSHGSNMSGGRSGNSSRESRKGHTLRTIPQASSTPVKSGSPASPAYRSQSGSSGAKASPHQRSSSLDQRSSSLEQRSQLKDVKNSSGRSESVNRSSGANRSASASRNGSGLANISDQSKGKSNGKTKNELQDIQIKGRGLSKQGTFVKESTNKNAPVISPGDKSRDITDNVGVKMRQKKQSESSQTNRHSSGSSKSNFSNTSNNSNSFSTTSSDSPPDSWSKTLNSYNLRTEPEVAKKGQTPFGSSVRRNILNDGQASKIPSPSRSGGKKSTAAVSGKSPGQIVVKSRSGSSLGKAEIKHAGSSNSLKLPGSRPTTPVVMGNAVLQGTRKGSDSSLGNKDEKKGTSKKGVTGKIAGLWRSESKKNKTDKKNASKLPVSKGNNKPKKALLEDVNTVQEKQDSSSKQNANRNTYILTESSVDGISKSSTYDKLSSTNDISQVPNHDSVTGSRSGTLERSRATGSTARPVLETDSDLNKTCREVTAFEVGVEYDLEEAWASNIEKSIASMSRSIEQNKNSSGVADRSTTFYDDFVDTSRMDLTNSPANRLSKSGSMSEIELEFGRIHSGTWTKKRSQNDVALLPNADETSRTMPLVKRSESLNLTAHLGVSHLEYDDDGQEVWIRRDDRLRASDITMGKKKKVFKGSSGFLNVVSKMFGGGSKKGAEKQSKSFHVSEKDLKKMNESNAKASKKEKLNKSEVKPGKSEAKALKAEQKAEAKMTKSLQKALKKEAKLSKSGKGKKSVDVDDVSSSTSSLKKSSEDLIEIDRDDDDVDDDVFAKQKSNGTLNRTAFTLSTNSSASVSDSVQTSPKTPEMKKSLSVITNQSDVKISNNNTSPGSTSFISNSSSGSGSPNCSQKSSPCFAHMTKTEMLIARRQRQISQESEHDDNVDKKKCVITTV